MDTKWVIPILIASLHLSVALVPLSSESATEELSQYGYICNETVRCDPTNFLMCFNGICSCNNEYTMIYNSEKSLCVTKANKACVVDNPVTLSIKVQLQAPGTQQLQCVENAYCDLNLKTCICSESMWMASESGFCVPKKLINETCTTPNDCRQGYGLICSNNVCTCNLETTVQGVYPVEGCVGQAEQPCINDLCTPFATCKDLAEGLKDPYQTANNSTTSSSLSGNQKISKMCQCNDDYYSTPRGRCSKAFGIKCDHLHRCKPGFQCVEDTCVCPYTTQIYNEAKGLCEAVVGGGCTANKSWNYQPEETVCIDGAICSNNELREILINPPADNWMESKCRCEDGLLANPSEGQCYLGFGQRCGTIKDGYMVESRFKCHDGARLACRNNQCQCKDNTYEFDKDVNMCVGLVGTECTKLVNYWELVPMPKGYSWKDGLPNGCTKGAACVEDGGNRSRTTCQCAGRSVSKQRCSDKKFPGFAIIVIAVVLSLVAFITICFYFYLKAKGQLITEMVLADG